MLINGSEIIDKTTWLIVGAQSLEIDRQKELMRVKGTMDAKALAQSLRKKLKRQVDIVLLKEEKEGEEGEKKDGDGGGGGKKGGGGGDGGQEEANAKVDQGNKMIMAPPGYGNIVCGNGYGYPPPPPLCACACAWAWAWVWEWEWIRVPPEWALAWAWRVCGGALACPANVQRRKPQCLLYHVKELFGSWEIIVDDQREMSIKRSAE